MPKEVRMTTHNKENGSGPKNEANTPGTSETEGSLTWANAASEPMKPPLVFKTAAIIIMIPPIMMMPWMKSLIAVAM